MYQRITKHPNLPVSWRMLVLTLVIGIVVLIPLYLLYNAGIISATLTIWGTVLVFIFAAGYESYLFYLITKAMISRVDKD
ncbi:MAG: hypothetical protein V7739_07515 [Motiliproteus sp.]